MKKTKTKIIPASDKLNKLWAEFRSALNAAAEPYIGRPYAIEPMRIYDLRGAGEEVNRMFKDFKDGTWHNFVSRDSGVEHHFSWHEEA